MTINRLCLAILGAASLAGCTAQDPAVPSEDASPPPAPIAPPADTAGAPAQDPAGTRLAGQPHFNTYTGTVEEGAECRVLRTDEGQRWAFNTDAQVAVGDRVSITAEVADASFCQEGEGTLIVERIAVIDPPAGN